MTSRRFGNTSGVPLWRLPAALAMVGMWWDWSGLRPGTLDQLVAAFGEGPVLFGWAFLICVLLYPVVRRVFE